jgi:hypothetical protein
MELEPVAGRDHDLVENARLLQEMRRARYHLEALLACKHGKGLTIEVEDGAVVAADLAADRLPDRHIVVLIAGKGDDRATLLSGANDMALSTFT